MSEPYKPMGYLYFTQEYEKLFGVKDRSLLPPTQQPSTTQKPQPEKCPK